MSAARARRTPPATTQAPMQRAHRRWTDAEIALLTHRYDSTPIARLAEELGRSYDAVRTKARRIAVRQFPEGALSSVDVAQIIGRHERTVRRWLSTGQLKGMQGPADVWHVRQVDLRSFASTHPAEVNRERADIVWLLRVMGGKAS